MKQYFLDASFVIAAGLKRDQNHECAAKMWPELLRSGVHLITTAFVFDEIVTFFNCKGEHDLAVHFGNILLNSPNVTIAPVGWDVFHISWGYFVRHQDKHYSLTDCISFIVMTERAISEALTFDAHFTQAGFQIVT